MLEHAHEDSEDTKPNGHADGFVKAPSVYTTGQLRQMELVPLHENVPGLLCEGMHILAGRPKAGKSQIVLQIAAALATGQLALGHFVPNPSYVIYYALEDGARRIQRRLQGLVRDGHLWPEDIAVYHPPLPTAWAKRLERIEEQLKGFDQDEPVVFFIDTWARFRPIKKGGDAYQDDYGPMSELASIAQDRPKTTIVATHHTKKQDDVKEITALVSGTYGLTGAVDGVMVLDRQTGKQEGVFALNVRDGGDCAYTFLMDKETGIWRYVGKGDLRATGDELAVLAAITSLGGAASPTAVAQNLGVSCEGDDNDYRALRRRMERMAGGKTPKLVRVSRNLYSPAPPEG
jgi:hypothetical protein